MEVFAGTDSPKGRLRQKHEHTFSEIHVKQHLKMKECSEGNTISNSDELGGIISYGEMNL